jgi:arylsulfatase A
MIPTRWSQAGLNVSAALVGVGLLHAQESKSMLPVPDASRRVNIIFILADDLGAEALGCYGGVKFTDGKKEVFGLVKTPNLDALAQAGIRFEHCFATPVCSPSRAQFLTGKYNFRVGFPDILGRNGATRSLDAQAHPTVAMRLKEVGYVTAVVGKWHLGDAGGGKAVPKSADQDTTCVHARECGFDRQCLFGGEHLEDYGEPQKGSYTPDILQDWALRFLDSRKGKTEPFFLYYASPIPHFSYLPTPLNPDGPGRGDDKMGKMYGNMKNFPYLVEYLDKQVGEILAKLKELGMRENTLVVFAGDNGTPPWLVTEMRDGRKIQWGKGTMKDTGSWVPFLASWPGQIAGESIYGGLADFSDIMPTCLELAGAQVPSGLDGVSFAPQLQSKPGKPREWVHSHYVNQCFVRDTKWKLRENGELYDVSGAPYVEKLVPPDQDTTESKAARVRLKIVLERLHPTEGNGKR